MTTAIYDKKPEVISRMGSGTHRYRWGVEEVQVASGMPEDKATVTKYRCSEVSVYAPLTRSSITEAVIAATWSLSREQKLGNDYHAAKDGLFTGEEAQKAVAAYREFIAQRRALKQQVEKDCAALEIV